MKLVSFLVFALLVLSTTLQAQVKLIFDTDFGGDADDLGAIAMLHEFANRGEVEILGIMCWNTEKYAVSGIDAVNTWYGRPDIPIGSRQAEPQETPWNHGKPLAEAFTHVRSIDNVPDATQLYRELLSQADDKSVVIVTVGPLYNIQALLDSEADSNSEMSGKDLVQQKVSEFVIMGGEFPEGEREWNFDGNMQGVTKYVVENIPIPITFLGYEVGLNIKTGEVFNELPKDHPLYVGFYHFSKYCPWLNEQFQGKIYDNSTYDQTAVLYAVRSGIGHYWHRVEGRCLPDEKGGNSWLQVKNPTHSYLVLDWGKEAFEEEIERFMMGRF